MVDPANGAAETLTLGGELVKFNEVVDEDSIEGWELCGSCEYDERASEMPVSQPKHDAQHT